MSNDNDDNQMSARSKSGWYNIILSIANPELRKLAEGLARGIDASVSEESLARTAFAERAIGAFSGWLESKAGGMDPLAGAALEKLSDILDFTTGSLYCTKKKDSAPMTQQTIGKNLDTILSDWQAAFFKNVGERLANIEDPAKLPEVKKRLDEEFGIAMDLFRVVQKANEEAEEARVRKKSAAGDGAAPPQKSATTINWEAKRAEFNAKWNIRIKSIDDKVAKLAPQVNKGVRFLASVRSRLENSRGGKR